MVEKSPQMLGTCGGVAGRVTLDPAGLCPVAPPGSRGFAPGVPGCASAETSGSPRVALPTVQGVARELPGGRRRVHAVFTVAGRRDVVTPVTIKEFPRTGPVGTERARTPGCRTTGCRCPRTMRGWFA